MERPVSLVERTMDLLALADFDLVATHGGFSRACRQSGRPKATLSRRVGELEDRLGVRLLERGAHGLRLTEAGARLHARVGPLLRELAEAGETVGAASDPPRGRLRVSAPILLSDTVLGPIAVAFARAYPEVRLEITAEDRLVDLSVEGYDVVIRVDPPPEDRLVGRCLLRDERWLVASPTITAPVAASDGAPRLPVVVRKAPQRDALWTVREGDRVLRFAPEPVLRLSTLPMLRDAVLAGGGAGLLPKSLVGRDVADGRLVRWGVADGSRAELWALHGSRRLVDAKVTAFMRHISAALAGLRTAFLEDPEAR